MIKCRLSNVTSFNNKKKTIKDSIFSLVNQVIEIDIFVIKKDFINNTKKIVKVLETIYYSVHCFYEDYSKQKITNKLYLESYVGDKL